ncbi:MAG TPA: class I SAM-dependent methyltransferase [Arachnia sp.]|nr:class I SAM-dependent methyltransferase [Arachnia sp.]HMT87500.1 class I SAM-dependent methyltransferase [Arachnia sp.]
MGSADRQRALDLAMAEPDPASLGAAERLRKVVAPEAAAWALTQAGLRRRARAKFSRADEMLFTVDGLEQATRESVRRWRAGRFRSASGVVWDLGCGIGADAMALAEAGFEVRAVEADAATADAATHNLALVGAGPAIHGLAEDVALGGSDAVFLDPARRTARGRTWNVADFSPSWDFVLALLASDRFVCVKLGPGLPKELIPDGVQACWVSDGGDVVEVSLWNRLPAGPCAVILPDQVLTRPEERRDLEVRSVGRYLIEPDGAVIRSGLLAEIAPGRDIWLLDDHIAYLSSDEPVRGPFGTCFEVLEVHDYDRKALRRLVRERGIGTLEIKKRGIDVDPAALRRELRPKGKASATVVLGRTIDGTKALLVRRV